MTSSTRGYIDFYLKNVVIILNCMLFPIKYFLNHSSMFFSFWVMIFLKKYFLSKIPLSDLIFINFGPYLQNYWSYPIIFFLIQSYSKILINAKNQITVSLTVLFLFNQVFLAKFSVFLDFFYFFINKKYNF